MLWDGCENDPSTGWTKKTDTYLTGTEVLGERARMVKVNGYDYLPADVYGKPLNFMTGGKELLGPYAAVPGLLDGYVWPHLELPSCTTKCLVAMYHHDTMAPLIWRVIKVDEDVNLHGQRTTQLVLDETYLANTPGGISNPYHDDYSIVDPALPGLINITSSRGTKMYLSKPHFYSDSLNLIDKYGLDVSGMKPDETKHNSRVYIESVTGAVVRSNIRLQYNLLLPPSEGCFGELDGKNIPGGDQAIIYPLYWVEERAEISAAGGKALNTHPIYAIQWVQYTLIPMCIFFTMGLIGAGLVCIRRGAFMIANPSMRVNEAGMRYHQWMHR